MREYKLKTKKGAVIITVNEFKTLLAKKELSKFNGNGYWVKDDLQSEDMVFTDEPLDATHVAWYK